MSEEEKETTESLAGHTCRVIAAHRASFDYTVVFRAGDTLGREERETLWPGWTWCVDTAQTGAWVPDTFIEKCGDSCVALRDYDSTELTVDTGDVLEALEEVGGWLWCVDSGGRRGWVPASCVEQYGWS
ncbi:MAG: SH3 domain-containing protein [Actinomycetota bacterium]